MFEIFANWVSFIFYIQVKNEYNLSVCVWPLVLKELLISNIQTQKKKKGHGEYIKISETVNV